MEKKVLPYTHCPVGVFAGEVLDVLDRENINSEDDLVNCVGSCFIPCSDVSGDVYVTSRYFSNLSQISIKGRIFARDGQGSKSLVNVPLEIIMNRDVRNYAFLVTSESSIDDYKFAGSRNVYLKSFFVNDSSDMMFCIKRELARLRAL